MPLKKSRLNFRISTPSVEGADLEAWKEYIKDALAYWGRLHYGPHHPMADLKEDDIKVLRYREVPDETRRAKKRKHSP